MIRISTTIKYKLYLLEVDLNKLSHQWDVFEKMVVRAQSERQARFLASNKVSLNNQDAWMDKDITTCEELTYSGELGIILDKFRRG